MAIKLGGGGGKAVMARPLREELSFLRLPWKYIIILLLNTKNRTEENSSKFLK